VIPIYENYEGYVPPSAVRKCVTRLLKALPPGHLEGLRSLVLTNANTLGKGKTKRVRGRKYRQASCLGFYHPATQQGGAWIEIVVDNVVGKIPAALLRWKLFIDGVFAKTVFHEVGHHLDVTIGSPSRTGEQAAVTWADILRRNYLRKHYWIQAPILRLFTQLFRPSIKRWRAEASKSTSSVV
jgi:hypothetical protein